MSFPKPLRVLLFQDLPGRWSARSLEHDVAVDGRNLEIVIDRILQLIFAHIDFDRRHGRAPLSTFPPAPPSILGCVRQVAAGAVRDAALAGSTPDVWPNPDQDRGRATRPWGSVRHCRGGIPARSRRILITPALDKCLTRK
jgi:hypothetical protein